MNTIIETEKEQCYYGTPVLYPGVNAEIKYNYETTPNVKLRILRIEAVNNDCILRFKNPQDLGIDFLVLLAAIPRFLTIPQGRLPIDFEVFSKCPHDDRSEPPPVRRDPPPSTPKP